jgi:hypothetical protein
LPGRMDRVIKEWGQGQKGYFVSGNRWPVVFGIVAALTGGSAAAQDLTQGKTPAQLFAGDCAACHKSTQGLAKGGDPRSIASFLREHYTTKPEMAEALAAYVVGSGRGQSPTDRGDSPGSRQGRGSASNDVAGRSTDGARPRGLIPMIPILGDEPKPPDAGDSPRPGARARTGPGAGDKPADGEPTRPVKPRPAVAVGDAPKSADDKDPPKSAARPDTRRSGDDDSAGNDAKPRSRAARTDDGRKPGDAPVPTGKLNSYARTGSSERDKATESVEERVSKLRSYATSGDPAPTSLSAPPKAVANPPPETPVVSPEPSSDATKDALKPAIEETPKSEAIKSEANDPSTPAAEDAPKLSKPRKPAADATAAAKRRTDAGNAPVSSPMSFFGRILSGGAKPRNDQAD